MALFSFYGDEKENFHKVTSVSTAQFANICANLKPIINCKSNFTLKVFNKSIKKLTNIGFSLATGLSFLKRFCSFLHSQLILR